MAKRKKLPESHIDVACTLPIPVLHYFQDVAKLSGTTVNDVLNVVLAIQVMRYQEPVGKDDARS